MSDLDPLNQRLYRAAKNNDLALLKEVLQHPQVNPNALDPFDEKTPLMEAAHKGHLSILNALIPVSDLSVTSPRQGGTALMFASLAGQGPCIEALVRHTPPERIFDTLDDQCNTALILAAAYGSTLGVVALLPFSNLHVTNRLGNTALMCAAARDHHDCVDLLLPTSPLVHHNPKERHALISVLKDDNLPMAQRLLPHFMPFLTPAHWAHLLAQARQFHAHDCFSFFNSVLEQETLNASCAVQSLAQRPLLKL